MNHFFPLGILPQGQVNNKNEVNQVMMYYNRNFKHILPNKYDCYLDCKNLLFPFEKEQIIELIN